LVLEFGRGTIRRRPGRDMGHRYPRSKKLRGRKKKKLSEKGRETDIFAKGRTGFNTLGALGKGEGREGKT